MPNSNIHNLLEQAVIAVSGMSGPSLPPGLLPASAWQQRGQKGIFGKGDEGRQLEPAPLVKKKNKRRGQPRPRKPRRCAATASAASAASAEGAAAAAIGADAAEEAEEPPEEEEEEEEEEESADEDVADPNDDEIWAAMLASTAEEAARQEDAARAAARAAARPAASMRPTAAKSAAKAAPKAARPLLRTPPPRGSHQRHVMMQTWQTVKEETEEQSNVKEE